MQYEETQSTYCETERSFPVCHTITARYTSVLTVNNYNEQQISHMFRKKDTTLSTSYNKHTGNMSRFMINAAIRVNHPLPAELFYLPHYSSHHITSLQINLLISPSVQLIRSNCIDHRDKWDLKFKVKRASSRETAVKTFTFRTVKQ